MCFLLFSPEASSSCEDLPAEEKKGNIWGFKRLSEEKRMTALSFEDQLSTPQPRSLESGLPLSLLCSHSPVPLLSQVWQTDKKK